MTLDSEATTQRLAEAISDGEPIDWDTELRGAGAVTETMRTLQLIQDVALAHRSLHPDVESPRDPQLPAMSDDSPIPLSWGSLRILGRLGGGASGVVLRAFDPSLQREVALKLLLAEEGNDSQTDGDKLIREARRMARVRHPNVLVIHGAGRYAGRPGFWTDLLSGRTLEELLSAQGPLGPHEAALVGLDVCRALAAVHAAGLLHRDVKTANIMREQGGRIVLMDFGSGTEAQRPSDLAEASARGTPMFMAPELLHGEAATQATDLYALGVVLYRLVTGRFPIEARTFSELQQRHQEGAVVTLRDRRADLPTAFVQVVERAIDPDPRRRFAGAGAMEAALAAAVGAGSTTLDSGRSEATRKRLWRWGGLAATVLVAVGALWSWERLSPGPIKIEASLYRLGDRSDERLQDGGKVAPGDRLYLELEAKSSVHVYVLNADQTGRSFVLFPGPDLALKNPLPTGRRLRLPGIGPGGRSLNWEVTSVGGRETFLVIASRKPLEDLERDIARMPRAQEGREISYAPVSPESGVIRGIGGMATSEPIGQNGSEDALRSMTDRLNKKAAARGGLWVWRVNLQNPGTP